MVSFLRKQYQKFLDNKRENILDLLFLIGILIFAFLITYRYERGSGVSLRSTNPSSSMAATGLYPAKSLTKIS